ncbi:MAG TPA: DUF4258 domain-containing protein [Candidatus Tripitaka californicus]|uniref:DUF4258 domain-containing protein n=1 Tax=Candidatus Tripitaka californicus TaxID=3367616 RepID=UPI00402A3EA1|nr:DUF4258 domain-containing protein [Planctomycetota bacterium]
MEIYLSRHARRQMKWRKISEEEIKDTVLHPEEIEDSIKGRKNAFKRVGQKWLKVTFVKENDKIIIITVIDKNK